MDFEVPGYLRERLEEKSDQCGFTADWKIEKPILVSTIIILNNFAKMLEELEILLKHSNGSIIKIIKMTRLGDFV